MRGVAGIVLILSGPGFVVAGLRHRARAAPPSARMQRMGEAVLPVVRCVLGYSALKAVVVWAAFDAGRLVSLLDLAGFLVLLASYGTWLTLRARPRAAHLAPGHVGGGPARGRCEDDRPRPSPEPDPVRTDAAA